MLGTLRAFHHLMASGGAARYYYAWFLTGGMALSGIQVVVLALVGGDDTPSAWLVVALVAFLVLSRFSAGLFYREAAALEERFEYAVDNRVIGWAATVTIADGEAATKAAELRAARPWLANSAGAILFSAELLLRCMLTVGVLAVLVGLSVLPLLAGAIASAAIGLRAVETLSSGKQAVVPDRTLAQDWLAILRDPKTRAEMTSLDYEGVALSGWEEAEDAVAASRRVSDLRAAAIWFGGQAVLGSATALSLWLAVSRYDPSAPVWLLAAVAVLVVQVQRQVASVTTTMGWIRTVLSAVESLGGVRPEHPSDDGPLPEEPLGAAFRNVTFSYADSEVPALQSVTISLEPGEMIGVTGPNGGGKSTLASLLLGELEPSSGTIRNGYSSRGVVYQDFGKFGLTLRQSVEMGRPDGREEEVDDALAACGLAALVDQLPGGADTGLRTVAVPFGQELSAGQWQRLSLGRAVHSVDGQPSLIVLDEATRYMDADLGAKVLASLAELRDRAKGSLVVVVSHRPADLRACDRVFFVSDGSVVEVDLDFLQNGVDWYVGN